ncbi:hypothetical protein LTR56_014553 [Elasticomyces elasticus]|nr:hypothetical protein LTR22_025004 [Elasticomyces elasticus]KAK3635677.1 hypothetical protein LTR56_014553 [Elasticomyces elasticus]KAK4916342.1 hypothetical protein LTR49_015576 [Elasticomyces elasticus]KAK4960359.1 hypothetical protein LTR10_003254 [Elasticomyces elasticus]KAK4969525.1 hypothetical protein LTR42_008796 [Elasticomyces elasticus]
MVYEPESGLVYTETVLKSCDCLRKSLQAKISDTPKDAPSKRTLWKLACRRLLDNIDKLGPDALAALPTALAERVWPASQRGQMSVQLWKIMAQSQPDLVTGTPHRWDYTTRGPLLEDTTQFLDRLRCFPVLETLCVHDESTNFARHTASGKRYGPFRCLDRRKCPKTSGPPMSSPLPLLQMVLGTRKSESVPHDHRTTCFRRSSYAPTRPSQEGSVPVSEPKMPNKRRKLKEGKSVSLDNLLDGF